MCDMVTLEVVLVYTMYSMEHVMYSIFPVKTKISLWGNSLALRVPKSIAQELGIQEGGEVDIQLKGETILIKKSTPTLKELVSRITPENKHEQIDWGEPVGKEIW